jgi:FkbM family methyltransferase
MSPDSSVVRASRFLRSDRFRRAPVRSVANRLRWRLHWRLHPDRPYEMNVGGMTMRLAHSSASSGVFLGQTSGMGASDPEIAAAFREVLRPGMVALDCGAHIGEYSLLFSRLVGPGGAVHAFEPDPRVFEFLKWNVERNGLTNVTANMLALSSSGGRADYALHPDATCSALAEFDGDGAGGVETVEVSTTSLDAYAPEHGLERVDAVKIDVEGAEGAVLEGAARILERMRPVLVFVECHTAAAGSDVRRALERAGYELDPSPPQRMHDHVLARPRA